ncbi:MAG: hypothetical protein JXL80_00080 [Planctomycetes bacterium]|nr:hypothetical protein [Planctomycetota bacterium]
MRFRRRVINQTLLYVLVSMVGLAVIISVLDRSSRSWGFWVFLGIAELVGAVAVGVSFVRSYRRQLTLCRGSAIELWSDSLVYRIDGRPPLVIRREDMEYLQLRPGPNGVLLVRGRDGLQQSLLISTGIGDFDHLYATLRQWCPDAPKGNALLRLRLWFFGINVLMIVASVAIILADNLWLVTAAAVAVLAIQAWRIRLLWRTPTIDKIGRRRIWFLAVVGLAVVGVAAMKWVLFLTKVFH